MEEQVILVDDSNNERGLMSKLEAHCNGGVCHRAFSIFLFNRDGETLIQQRAEEKYHSAGLWSNTVCGHPRKGETAIQAAHRRLDEEMGICCSLQERFEFKYQAQLDNGMVENEHDHVIFGRFDGEPIMNSEEVQDYQWISPELLVENIRKSPELYTPWLRMMIDSVMEECARIAGPLEGCGMSEHAQYCAPQDGVSS